MGSIEEAYPDTIYTPEIDEVLSDVEVLARAETDLENEFNEVFFATDRPVIDTERAEELALKIQNVATRRQALAYLAVSSTQVA